MNKTNKWLGLLVVLLSLIGCKSIHYQYIAPASEQGKICITHCAGVREMCHGNEIQRAQYDQALCEQRSESIYRNCLHHADSKDEAKKCYRPACWSHENTWRCDENYRQCFVSCGGTIHIFEQ